MRLSVLSNFRRAVPMPKVDQAGFFSLPKNLRSTHASQKRETPLAPRGSRYHDAGVDGEVHRRLSEGARCAADEEPLALFHV